MFGKGIFNQTILEEGYFFNFKEERKMAVGESIIMKVGQFFGENGYSLANENGVPLKSLDGRNSLGILWKDPGIERKKHLWGLFKGRRRRALIGVIIFSDSDKCALVGYGAKYASQIDVIAKSLAVRFSLVVQVFPKEDYRQETTIGEIVDQVIP